MKRLDFDILDNQAKQVYLQTHYKFKGFYTTTNNFIDLLFRFLYETDLGKEAPQTDRENVEAFCRNHFFTSVYSFKSCLFLCFSGYYNEGAIIVRHLFELLIRMKYMNKHPQTWKKYLKRKSPASFKVMIDDIAPSCYRDYEMLCGYAHGGLESFLFKFRSKRRSDGSIARSADVGIEYNEDSATYLMNLIFPFYYAYLKLYIEMFPHSNKSFLVNQYNETILPIKGWFIEFKKPWTGRALELIR